MFLNKKGRHKKINKLKLRVEIYKIKLYKDKMLIATDIAKMALSKEVSNGGNSIATHRGNSK